MIGSNFTGIGHYIENLVKHLSQKNKHNKYILFMNNPEYSQFKIPNKNFQKLLVDSPIYSFKEQTTFAKILYQHKLDLVHFPHFNAPILYLKKNIVTIHDVTLNTHAKNYIKKLAYKLSFYTNCLKAKKIICVSKFSKQQLNKTIPFTKNKSQVIYEGCIFSKPAKSLAKQNYLFYAGNWKSHKNIENLILAFEILKNQYNYPGDLKLTGSPSADHPKPKELINKSKHKKSIHILNKVSKTQLATLFTQAQLYVQPSLVEGFGLPVLEAFFYNTPVACSNTGALPEVAGRAALYFNPKDPADIAHTIHKLISNQATVNKLAKQAKLQLKLFSFATMTDETLKVYQDVF